MTTKTRHPKTTKPANPATTGGEVRVALYLRISTDEEHRPYSLEAREHRLGASVTSQRGWSLVRTFVDQARATLERPALAQALTEARAGPYDLLLVYRVDRLARSVRGLPEILEDLEAAGAASRSATEPFDTTTPAGRMMAHTGSGGGPR